MNVAAHLPIIAEVARDTDLTAHECEAVARAVYPFVGLSQRNREAMSAYRSVINDDTPSGRAARHVRDTLLARQGDGL